MKVFVKNISALIELKNNGMTFDIYDPDDTFRGKLKLARGGIVWCPGKTRLENGVKIPWGELIEYFESEN